MAPHLIVVAGGQSCEAGCDHGWFFRLELAFPKTLLLLGSLTLTPIQDLSPLPPPATAHLTVNHPLTASSTGPGEP